MNFIWNIQTEYIFIKIQLGIHIDAYVSPFCPPLTRGQETMLGVPTLKKKNLSAYFTSFTDNRHTFV